MITKVNVLIGTNLIITVNNNNAVTISTYGYLHALQIRRSQATHLNAYFTTLYASYKTWGHCTCIEHNIMHYNDYSVSITQLLVLNFKHFKYQHTSACKWVLLYIHASTFSCIMSNIHNWKYNWFNIKTQTAPVLTYQHSHYQHHCTSPLHFSIVGTCKMNAVSTKMNALTHAHTIRDRE